MIWVILIILFVVFVIFSLVSIQEKLDAMMRHLGMKEKEILLTDSQIEEILNEEKTNQVVNEVFDESRNNSSNK